MSAEVAFVRPDIPGTKVRSYWRYITAAEMERILESNYGNRHMDEAWVRKLQKDIEADRFEVTHQGLGFDEDDALIDGQHRGTAQVRAGVDLWWLVTTGLPRKSQRRMDSGKKRQMGQFLEGKHRDMRASAMRLSVATFLEAPTVKIAPFTATLNGLTPSEIEEAVPVQVLDRLAALSTLASRAARLVVIGPSPLLAAAALVLDDDDAVTFLTGVAEGVGLEEGDPRLALIKMRGEGGRRLQRNNAALVALKVAVAYARGDKMKHLKSSQFRTVELHDLLRWDEE